MADLAFDSSLVVLIDEEGLTCSDVERRVAGVLTEQGYAKDTFAQAILDREANFPTALDMSGLNVAIPHCDVANVNKAAFCMAVLKNPVAWHKMDDPEDTCEVSVVVMLALTEAHAHLDMLQKVVGFVQDQELVKKVIASETAEQAFELVAPQFA